MIGLTLAFFAFVLVEPMASNARMSWTFAGVGAAFCAWQAILWLVAKRRDRWFRIEYVPPLKSHYVQASVQLCIYAYWGWYWPNVYAAAPLILAQMVFVYVFDALLTWSRGRDWRLGFGPVPVVLSTNLFMWFKDDWFVFQFLMIAACILGKEFIKWNREGRRTHIFNPSAFGLALVSIVLITTQTTRYTWGLEVATTLGRPPHIYLLIFCLGLVVQYLFAVTLMTLSAVAVLCLMNVIYTGSTGLYQFVDTNIPIAIFLGLHLLMTDPSTSPRTNAGRIVFGGLYGAANFVLFSILGSLDVPDFYDKLIPVPFLNLCVPMLDRMAKTGIVGRFTRWEMKFSPRKLNLVHMSGWIALFALMLSTGFVEAPHQGASIAFWKKAYDEGKPGAGKNLFKMIGSQADGGSAAASNELGLIYLRGTLTKQDPAAAAHYFAQACELGNPRGCENVVRQFLFLHQAQSNETVTRALDRIEQECGKSSDGAGCYLTGYAYETGSGRVQDTRRALELYELGCARGTQEACASLTRVRGH